MGLSQTVGTVTWSQQKVKARKFLPREIKMKGGNEPVPGFGDTAGWAAEGYFRVSCSPQMVAQVFLV